MIKGFSQVQTWTPQGQIPRAYPPLNLTDGKRKLLCATGRVKKLKDPWRRWAACHGFSPTTLGTFWLVCLLVGWLIGLLMGWLAGLFFGWLVGWLCKLVWHFFISFFYCGFSCCVHVRRSTFPHPQHAHGHQTTRQRCCHNSCPCQFAFTMPTASSSSRPSGFHFSTCFLICFIFFRARKFVVWTRICGNLIQK